MRKNIKPNFRVKHPYAYLIHSILLGIVMLFAGIFSVTLFKFEKPDNQVLAYENIEMYMYANDDESNNNIYINGNSSANGDWLSGSTYSGLSNITVGMIPPNVASWDIEFEIVLVFCYYAKNNWKVN